LADTLTDTGLEPVPSPEFDYHALMVEAEFVKAAFKAAYAHRFRFETFLGAFKYGWN